MDYKVLLKALSSIEDDRNISRDVIIGALKEALIKAYKKNVELPDLALRVDFDEKTGHINMFQQYNVVETVEDDELEISLEDARLQKEDYEIGDVYEMQVSIKNLSRASASLARNVIKQKIREAEKLAVYEEYSDLLDEMVLGIVESVEEKFVLVDLGRTIAMMPASARIPGEIYREGQKLRVIITDVKRETKGSQVLVSRADSKLVKRLFEKEVPEIYQGVVEIKAIARDAGDRTKMAVYSHDPDVDPIGACIGPRGSRVQEIITELQGEKIDIFEWSDNLTDLVKNALAPAEVIAVVPTEDKKSLIVVVNQDQLSLAIGRRGKNARLAVRLTDKKIDIKTEEELEEQGIDYRQMLVEYEIRLEKEKREAAAKELEKMRKEAAEAEERRQAAIKAAQEAELDDEDFDDEYYDYEDDYEEFEDELEEIDEIIEEAIEEIEEAIEEEIQEEKTEDLSMKQKLLEIEVEEYVSVFEKLVGDTSKPKQERKDDRKRKKRDDEEDHKLRSIDIRKDLDYEIKPIYTEEELEEIARQEEEEELSMYDDYMDYLEYDDDEYYEDIE